jgi:hypothetical protein
MANPLQTTLTVDLVTATLGEQALFKLKVFLNGQELEHCLSCNEAEGWCILMDDDGREYTRHGDVTITGLSLSDLKLLAFAGEV